MPPLPPPLLPPVIGLNWNISSVKIAVKLLALYGVKLRKVTATTTEEVVNPIQFVNWINEVDHGSSLKLDNTNKIFKKEDVEAVPVITREWAPYFIIQLAEFDIEYRPLSQYHRTT